MPSRIAESIASLGPTVTLNTLVGTLVIGIGTLSGLYFPNEFKLFSLLKLVSCFFFFSCGYSLFFFLQESWSWRPFVSLVVCLWSPIMWSLWPSFQPVYHCFLRYLLFSVYFELCTQVNVILWFAWHIFFCRVSKLFHLVFWKNSMFFKPTPATVIANCNLLYFTALHRTGSE